MVKKQYDEEFELAKAEQQLCREHPESDGMQIWARAVGEVEQRRLERVAEAAGKGPPCESN